MAVPHMAARRAHRGADDRLGAAGRDHAEDGDLRLHPDRPSGAAGRGSGLRPVDRAPGRDRHRSIGRALCAATPSSGGSSVGAGRDGNSSRSDALRRNGDRKHPTPREARVGAGTRGRAHSSRYRRGCRPAAGSRGEIGTPTIRGPGRSASSPCARGADAAGAAGHQHGRRSGLARLRGGAHPAPRSTRRAPPAVAGGRCWSASQPPASSSPSAPVRPAAAARRPSTAT